MRTATDADFNQMGRYLSIKLAIYFDGLTAEPLTVVKSQYLMDASWLEEGSADSSSLFGTVSSNELTFRLLNKDGMFSPTNAAGPYYGKIKAGVPVVLYIKPENDNDDVDWTQLGIYFTTGWTAEVTGLYADVTANDVWYNILKQPIPNYPVVLNKTYKQFLESIFTPLGYAVTISDELSTNVPYCFLNNNLQQSLQDITAAALAYVTSAKTGEPVIGALSASGNVRAVLTDNDQIKSASVKQSIVKSYEGVSLTYSLPQISGISKLIDVSNITVPTGDFTVANAAFTKGPMWQISTISIQAPSDGVTLTGYTATPWLMTFTLHNTKTELTVSVSVQGTVVELTAITISDDVSKIQTVTNNYIQNAAYAQKYKNALTAFVTCATPVLTIEIRGNPLLNIGDKVVIQSDKYHLDFIGIIQRLKYDYVGSLSCTMTLLNANVLQGVQ